MLRRLMFLTLLGFWASAASGAGAAGTPLNLNELSARLASNDFAVRDAAQKQLDQLPPSQLASLQQLAPSQTDPEIKARLEARIAAMEIDLATHPQPISLHLDNATPAQTVAALAKALQIDPELMLSPRDAGAYTSTAGPFTIHIEQAPFWTVLGKLNQDHTLAFSNEKPVHFQGSPAKGDVISEPFCVHPYISRGQPDPQGFTPVQIQLLATVDPRVNIARCTFEFTDFWDAENHNLLRAPIMPQPSLMQQHSRFAWSDGTAVKVPAADKTIALLKATLHVMIIVKQETIAIANVRDQLNKPIDTPQGPLTLIELTEDPATVSFGMRTQRKISLENEHTMVPIAVQFLTDTGSPLITTSVAEATRTEIPLPVKPSSYRAQILCPSKVATIDVPIEFKDLAIDR